MVKPDATEKVAETKLVKGDYELKEGARGLNLVQSCTLLLSNVSMTEVGQKHLIGEGA